MRLFITLRFRTIKGWWRYCKRCWAWCRFFRKKGVEENDPICLGEIFSFALRRQADFMEKAAAHEDFEKDVKNIRIVACLFDRAGCDEYSVDHIRSRYSEDSVFSEGRGSFKEVTVAGRTTWRLIDNRTSEKRRGFERHVRKVMDHERYMYNQDMALIGQILQKQMERWWC